MDPITALVALVVAALIDDSCSNKKEASEEEGGVRMSGVYDHEGKPIPEGDRRLDPPPVY